MSTQSGCTTRAVCVPRATLRSQRSSGASTPHHRRGTARTSTGIGRSRLGGGHGALHRFPSKTANGSTMPSRRSTPTAKAVRESAATAIVDRTTTAVASVRTVRSITVDEYTRRPAAGSVAELTRDELQAIVEPSRAVVKKKAAERVRGRRNSEF